MTWRISKPSCSVKKSDAKDYTLSDSLHIKFYNRESHNNRRKKRSCQGPEVKRRLTAKGQITETFFTITVMALT